MKLPEELVAAAQAARSVGIITGAGMSADSGISTYRGKGGIYDDPDSGDEVVFALTGSTLKSDPDKTWKTLATLARQSAKAQPHAGHRALVEWEAKVDKMVILTQNVDGLHEQAGSRDVIDIHGNLRTASCQDCGYTVDPLDWSGIEGAPQCVSCSGVMRPDVVLFEEMLPRPQLGRMERAFFKTPSDLTIVVGTTALFPYIVEPVRNARLLGYPTCEINPERTDLSGDVQWFVQATAAEALTSLADAACGRSSVD